MTMTTDPLIGRQLGDYRIVDILGRGGMAHVYRGFDKKLQRYAAVKVIDSNLLANNESEEEYRARFQREARAIAHLSHPNIVGVYQFGEVGSLYYMAMVFIEGRDLGQILKEHAANGTSIPNEQIAQIVKDIAAALDHAHSQGVIHRDIKPSNIMVMRDGHAVLTDFGLALSVPEGSMGNTFGSAHYIAPEQAISSAKAMPQSDLYSLGVVLYQMLTGKVPFDDPSAMSVALKHLSEPPPPIRHYNSRISPATERVVLKALEKEPSKRYRTGAQLADALIEALYPIDKTPSRASRPSLAEKVATGEYKRLDPTATGSLSSSKSQSLARVQPAARPNRLPLWIGGALLLVIIAAAIMLVRGGGGAALTPSALIVAGRTSATTLLPTVTRTSETPVPVALITDEASPVPPTMATTAAPTTVATIVATTVAPTVATTAATTAATTVAPTVTPSPTQTATETLTLPPSPTQEVLIAPTLVELTQLPTLDPNAPHILLIYDSDQLIMINPSPLPVNFVDLRFVQEMSNGTRRTFSALSIPEADLELLRHLQHDASITKADLGRQLNLSQPAVHHRVRRLEERGYIRRYVALLDRELLGLDLTCFVQVSVQRHHRDHIVA
ncbi:MAG: protein kinase, partial [Anaerolinea sp.]|nr:protein kinase [Anaerolinea sp.]